MRKTLTSGFICLLFGLLIGCSDPTPPVEYQVSTVVPNPAQPGGEVTLYGILPENPELLLDTTLLSFRPIPDGVVVKMPDALMAGVHTVFLKQGSTSKALTTLQVQPVLNTITLNAGMLTLQGKGWKTTQETAKTLLVDLNGVNITPKAVNHHAITAQLPEGTLHGNITVKVLVNGLASESKTLVYQAASVTGSVQWPAVPSAQETAFLQQVALPAQVVGKVLLVRLKGFSETCLQALPLGEAEVHEEPSLSLVQLKYPSTDQASQALKLLQQVPCVEGVEYDDVLKLQDAVTPILRQQTLSPNLGTQWFWPLVGLAALRPEGGQGVTVAVLDSGVYPHEEYASQLLPGFNFLDNTADTTDRLGHGTHVTGLIAGSKNLISPAPKARILPIKVTEESGSVLALSKGILYAVNALPEKFNPHPADVLSMSLGLPTYSPELASAVKTALSKGAILVAATGNYLQSIAYPAALPGVIPVTSISGPKNAYQPAYATHGPGTLITAYGGDTGKDQNGDNIADGILSTDIGGYSLRAGTSMATPQVSGLVAYLLSTGVPKILVKQTLLSSTTDLGVKGRDANFGHGLMNARLLSTGEKRTYLLAFDVQGKVLGWSPAQQDGTFTLKNLPDGDSLKVQAFTDANNNGLLGEAGELASNPTTVTLIAGEVKALPELTLNPTSGENPVPLNLEGAL